MHLDVLYLRDFYYRRALGRAVQRALQDQMKRLWPDVAGQTVVGFGFAVPLLRPFMADAARLIALMPGAQGVMPWPARQPNVSVLCHEGRWPIETGSVDRLMVLHGLDSSENPAAVLEETYRVLGGAGRAVFIVPNRTSLWARRVGTPFSLSQPYTATQLDRQLKWHGFTPIRHASALYQPPWNTKFWLNTGPMIERIGHMIPAWRAAGALIVEVEKKIPRPKRPGLGQIISVPNVAGQGALTPQPNRSADVAK